MSNFKAWLNTPPNKEDLFFVNIRETHQVLKKTFGKMFTRSNVVCFITILFCLLIMFYAAMTDKWVMFCLAFIVEGLNIADLFLRRSK